MSRKQSAYFQQMEERRRAAQEATRKTWNQYLTDTCVVTLNEFGFGKDRIQKFLEAWGKNYDLFFDSLRKEPETDYYREKLDATLKPLIPEEEFESFEQRYEYLPEMRY